MNDLISVIVNAYNEEKHIKKCIDSIINQNYKNIEIIVVNDGSTDNTLNILNSYNEPRLKIISHENKGLSLSRNDGIDNAKGKYIYFLDADDFIEARIHIKYFCFDKAFLLIFELPYSFSFSYLLGLPINDFDFFLVNRQF